MLKHVNTQVQRETAYDIQKHKMLQDLQFLQVSHRWLWEKGRQGAQITLLKESSGPHLFSGSCATRLLSSDFSIILFYLFIFSSYCFFFYYFIKLTNQLSLSPPPWGPYLSLKTHFPETGGLAVKNSPTNSGDLSSILGLGRSPREGNSNSLQCSCLENPMDRGAWWATVHGEAKSQTPLVIKQHKSHLVWDILSTFLHASSNSFFPFLCIMSASSRVKRDAFVLRSSTKNADYY